MTDHRGRCAHTRTPLDCTCDLDPGHAGPHYCPECTSAWTTPESLTPQGIQDTNPITVAIKGIQDAARTMATSLTPQGIQPYPDPQWTALTHTHTHTPTHSEGKAVTDSEPTEVTPSDLTESDKHPLTPSNPDQRWPIHEAIDADWRAYTPEQKALWHKQISDAHTKHGLQPLQDNASSDQGTRAESLATQGIADESTVDTDPSMVTQGRGEGSSRKVKGLEQASGRTSSLSESANTLGDTLRDSGEFSQVRALHAPSLDDAGSLSRSVRELMDATATTVREVVALRNWASSADREYIAAALDALLAKASNASVLAATVEALLHNDSRVDESIVDALSMPYAATDSARTVGEMRPGVMYRPDGKGRMVAVGDDDSLSDLPWATERFDSLGHRLKVAEERIMRQANRHGDLAELVGEEGDRLDKLAETLVAQRFAHESLSTSVGEVRGILQSTVDAVESHAEKLGELHGLQARVDLLQGAQGSTVDAGFQTQREVDRLEVRMVADRAYTGEAIAELISRVEALEGRIDTEDGYGPPSVSDVDDAFQCPAVTGVSTASKQCPNHLGGQHVCVMARDPHATHTCACTYQWHNVSKEDMDGKVPLQRVYASPRVKLALEGIINALSVDSGPIYDRDKWLSELRRVRTYMDGV